MKVTHMNWLFSLNNYNRNCGQAQLQTQYLLQYLKESAQNQRSKLPIQYYILLRSSILGM